jgi:2,3-bisphosphoglycerate-dependent phosphoglycerate mutase
LTPHGVDQAQETGKLLDGRGYKFDVALTSELQRAVQTCEVVLQVIDPSIPVIKAWQLNERHYGELQGRAKDDPEVFAQYGDDQLMAWRREFYATPPAMESSHPYYQPPPAPLTGKIHFDASVALFLGLFKI